MMTQVSEKKQTNHIILIFPAFVMGIFLIFYTSNKQIYIVRQQIQQKYLDGIKVGSNNGSDGQISKRIKLPLNASDKVRKRRFPSAILIGSKKSGTSTFLKFLCIHTDIVRASDEVNFFDRDNKYNIGPDWYLSKMPLIRSNQIAIEGTPQYFVDEKVPKRVFDFDRSVRLLLILRDPVKRLISDYTHERDYVFRGRKYPEFHDLVFDKEGNVNVLYHAVRDGLYHKHLSRWLQHFPLERIHIMDGELFITDPVKVLQEVEKFLNLRPLITADDLIYDEKKGFFCMKNKAMYYKGCMSPQKGREHPKIPLRSHVKLRDFYMPHNKDLFSLVGQTYSWANMTIDENF